MSRIVPKLNLNKTPQLVENNSLVMAKNIRLLEDGTIGPDTSLEEVEKEVGNGTNHIIHHDAVIKTITNYKYTILNVDATIALTRDDISPEDAGLEVSAFDFYNYHPRSSNEFPTISVDIDNDNSDRTSNNDEEKYVEINSSIECTIYCYVYNGNEVRWSRERFTYNQNENALINNNGYRLYLAVYEGYYHNGYDVPAATNLYNYYYIALPAVLFNNIIVIRKYNYFVINPLYRTHETEEVVIKEAYDEEKVYYNTIKYIGQIVGLDNKIYFFKQNNYIKYSEEAVAEIHKRYPDETFIGESRQDNKEETFDVNNEGYITRRGLLFEDEYIIDTLIPVLNNRVSIFEYDEVQETFTTVKCAWRYSGGKINGCVTVNSTGEHILTVCEYDVPNGKLVPIKHINLKKCKVTDDESVYTQAPNIPITNLLLDDVYVKHIPTGVYQFFIRYKIHDNFYTTWFPCSKELFAGSKKQTNTLQGSIKHIDTHENSNYSFVFNVEHLFPQYCNRFEEFQLGFIISSESGVVARSWKHFKMTKSANFPIYFDYNKEDIEEINIDDLLKVNFDIFNVENVAPYKNKLYVSNYKETDFNENLYNYAKQIKIKFKLQDVSFQNSNYYFNDIPLNESEIIGIYDSFGTTEIKNTFANNNYCIIQTIEDEPVQENTIERGWFDYHIDGFSTVSPEYHSVEEEFGNARVVRVYIKYNGQNYYIYNNNAGIKLEDGYNTNEIIDNYINEIKDYIIGVDINGNYKAVIDGNTIDISNIVIEYVTYSWTYTNNISQQSDYDGQIYQGGWYVYPYTNKITRNVNLKNLISTTLSTQIEKEYNTLLPFTKYDFYVHYVKQNGIATNGYFIGTKEITKYCKGYVQSERISSPITILNSIEDLDDLCFYDSTNENYAQYTNPNTGIVTTYYMDEINNDTNYIIYPTFENIVCPDGYVGCFISISKYGNNIAQTFNHHTDLKQERHILDCLDLDCLLYNLFDNITVINNNGVEITKNAVYYSSSSTNPVNKLGCSGHIEFNQHLSEDTIFWVVLGSVDKPYNNTLRKLTPYIKLSNNSLTSYSDYNQVNSPGYYCNVKKLNMEFCNALDASNMLNPTGYYVSGNDVYIRTINDSIDDLNLTEVNDRIEYHPSTQANIFSNFNLNHVSLTNDLTPIIRRYDVTKENNAEEGTIVSSEKQLITLVDSLVCSFILELKSMYRDYIRKPYYEYTKNKIVEFNNTIRSSSIDVDEIYRYIYRFEATEYYNVPTQRGIITNLISVANTLYVHCEHSLFKFSDNKTINADSEEVTLQENDIFNSGITEVFDAQYGYAGLKSREQSIVTYNAYIFYDEVTKTIYAFGGEQQIGSISSPIKKLIDKINPTDVRFVADELRNRFFVNLINKNGNCCLSFNFNSKSFISIHDFEFDFGFHSRRHTYFVHKNFYNSNPSGWSIYRIADYVLSIRNRTDTQNQDVIVIHGISYVKNYVAYQNCYKQSIVQVSDCDRNIILNEVNAANSCVDIIVNTEYEVIKVLNYLSWICSEIRDYGIQSNQPSEEIFNRKYSGTKLRIYSDTTNTSLFDLIRPDGNQKIANEQRNIDSNGNPLPNLRSWQYPQYNCGVWSMNYFRDVQNTEDVFEYMDAPNGLIGEIGYEGTSETTDLRPFPTRQNLTQENSLLYGKYFVIRFIFNNKNFKLENIKLNMGDYGKTK